MVATIPPVADWCRHLVAGDTSVTSLMRPGRTAHGYEPGPAEAQRIAEAVLIVGWGGAVDHWLGGLVTGTDARVVWLYAEPGAAHAPDENPHAWLDPARARGYVARLADELAAATPEHAAAIRKRAAAYDGELAVLQARMQRAARAWDGYGIVCLHDAWPHFLAACGVANLGSIYAASGAPPSAANLVHLTEALRAQPYPAIAVEPQFSPAVAETLAQETGAPIIVLDPLGRTDTTGYDTYEAMMHSNVDALAAVLPPIPAP